MADEAVADHALTMRSVGGDTVTIRPEAVIAIITGGDMKSTSLLLQGGFTISVRGTGEALRKKVFGLSPSEVKNAVKQQAGGRGSSAPRLSLADL